MTLTAEQIEENWNKFLSIIDKGFTGERREKLLNYYKSNEERFAIAPASGTNYFHSAFPGGYIYHILKVIDFASKTYSLWKQSGANMEGYTIEELLFVAIHHDLGKLGDLENDFYIPNPSDWHVKNQGKIYDTNNKISRMAVPDRGLFTLQQLGITLTEEEYIGIKIHDGVFDEANKFYLCGYGLETKLKTNLFYVIHQADTMAARIELEEWKKVNNK